MSASSDHRFGAVNLVIMPNLIMESDWLSWLIFILRCRSSCWLYWLKYSGHSSVESWNAMVTCSPQCYLFTICTSLSCSSKNHWVWHVSSEFRECLSKFVFLLWHQGYDSPIISVSLSQLLTLIAWSLEKQTRYWRPYQWSTSRHPYHILLIIIEAGNSVLRSSGDGI